MTCKNDLIILELIVNTYRLIPAEEEETLEVVVAYTVAEPWAMMIHLWDAYVADATVVCS